MRSHWRETQKSALPHGESVLCWDAINGVMFVAWTSGGDLFLDGTNKPTHYEADWWRPLPNPPGHGRRRSA